jgi:carboxyl-terminal processing protease
MPRRNLLILFVSAVVSFACYRQALMSHYGATLTEALNIIDRDYIDPVDSRVLFEGAMDGMVGQLDPYSGYTPPEEYNQFQQTMDGEFGGIGIIVEVNQETGHLTVLSPLVGTPAYEAGLKSGDVILAIDGTELKDVPLSDSVKLMRGEVGTLVRVRIQHENRPAPIEYELQRATIPIESVLGDARRQDGTWVFRLVDRPNVGYIRIVNFAEKTGEELQAALASYKLSGQKIDGLIIDLRGNAGGLLTAAIETCDAFLDHGVIVTTRGRDKIVMDQYDASLGTELPEDVPLVILIDKYSASASEIVAACLQDHERAIVVGQRSWGKGTVQNVRPLEGGRSALRLTIGSYWRPSGQDIHKRKDAKETDPWGVSPNAGQEVNPTNQELETFVLARRRRDVTSYEDLLVAQKNRAAAPAEPPASEPPAPPVPTPEPEPATPMSESDLPPVPTPDADTDAPATAAAEKAAAANALLDPATLDPQLQQAIQRLQEEIDRKAKEPRRA